ncbi:MAG: Fe-S protein assembly co-chaperone HscB [Candidatus Dasytiphilus stammeri]
MNYFKIFGLPINFKLDTKLLEARFYDLQRKFHPDRYLKNSEDKFDVLTKSALVNQAWKVLSNPLSRAEYLLLLHGFDVNSEQHNNLMDTNFLKLQFDLREELENIEQKACLKELSNLANRIESSISKIHYQIEQEMESQNWDKAANTLRQIRMFTKLRFKIEDLENKLLNL